MYSTSVMKWSMDLIGLLHIQLIGFTVSLLSACRIHPSLIKGEVSIPEVCVHVHTHVYAYDCAWTYVCSLGVVPQELSTLFFEVGLGFTNWAILSGYQVPETGLSLPSCIQAYSPHMVL